MFEYFMENVVKYCVPGNLTELEIEFNLHRSENFEYGFVRVLLDQVRPILRRLEKLSLTNNNCRLDKVFEFFRRDLTNLKSLTLERFDFDEGWTHVFPNELSKIAELRLFDVKLRETIIEFGLFLDQLTNLEVFVHLGFKDGVRLTPNTPATPKPELIANCLYRRFPHLKGFGCYLDDNQQSIYSMGNRLNFLKDFTSLTEIHFKCFPAPTDIHSIIQFVPNLKVLSMVKVRQLHHSATVRSATVHLITKTIKEIIDQRRDRFPRNDRVHLIVNRELYREFKEIENISKWIKLSVDHRRQWIW